jgi:hypothetical protein
VALRCSAEGGCRLARDFIASVFLFDLVFSRLIGREVPAEARIRPLR